MKQTILLYLTLLLAGAACSDHPESFSPEPDSRGPQATLTFSAGAGTPDYSVSIFEQKGTEFLFSHTITTGWTEDGKLQTHLPIGKYRFLFARNYGQNTLLQPELQKGITLFDSLRFITRSEANKLYASDELFLQDRKADSTYAISGNTTIACTLKRSVSQILLQVKRGKSGANNTFTPLPFTGDENILSLFGQIRLELEGIGKASDIKGNYYGSGFLSTTWKAGEADSIITGGFAAFTGPYFFPGADEAPIRIRVSLLSVNNDPAAILQMETTATPKRNERLIVTAWYSVSNFPVGISITTTPIRDNINGEEGIWDDIVN